MKSFLRQIEESFQSLEEKQERWQDSDGDGKWYEPGEDVYVDKSKNNDPECDSCSGSGCDVCKYSGMKPKYQNVEQCTKCKGEGCDHCDGKGYHEKVDEISTSAGAGSYMSKNAWRPADDDIVEVLGYKRVQEAMDRKYEQLIEGYRTFATGNPKLTPEQKVKESIKNVARQLKEIETNIGYTARLKTESGISHSGFKPATLKALTQISERLIKISERVRSLGE